MKRRQRFRLWFDTIDLLLIGWMARNGLGLLRLSVGLVFLWFGALKFAASFGPSESMAQASLTFLPQGVYLLLLGMWEIIIGVGFITGKWMRLALLLLFLQLPGVLLLVAVAPAQMWTNFPFVPSVEGQSIIKHLVLIAAGLVIGSTVRGGGLVDNPQALAEARDQQFARSFAAPKS